MTDDKVADIPILLFQRLASANPSFKPSVYMNNFTTLSTNLERVNFVYQDLKRYQVFPESPKDTKSDSRAVELREKGNKKFQLSKYTQALEEYTRSVATAGSREVLALAYANRSACLYKLHLYGECISDIDRALANNYPNDQKGKLVDRRERALKLQKPAENYHEEIPKIPECQENPQIRCARDCVEIKVNGEFGRHVVATRDIQIGEEISVERSYASVATTKRFIHCHECLKLCYNLIPCENCTQALFCSEDCKEKARNAYHRYECPILLSIVEFGMINSILIALKVTLLAREDYKNLNTFQFDEKDYHSDRYKEVHGLYTPRKSLSNHDSFYRAVLVAVLYHSLKTVTDFFENETMETGFKDVMLHQLQITLSNGVNIFEYARDGDFYERTHFGGGVYPFFSLFNHSCCPNVEGSFYGSTLVLRAINTIQRGQQCFINYDIHYGTTPKVARQAMLSENFFFDCKCKACVEDWEPKLIDFQINSLEIWDIERRLLVADVEFAKQILPVLITELQKCERLEPQGKALNLKKMICCCFITLGNKRRISD